MDYSYMCSISDMGRKRKEEQSDIKLTSIALHLVKEQVSQKRNKRKKTKPEDIYKRPSDEEIGRYEPVKIKKCKSDRCSSQNGEKTDITSSPTQGFFGISVEKDNTSQGSYRHPMPKLKDFLSTI
jgi:hypothetical protein